MIDSVFCNDCCSHDFPTSTITILWHFVRRMMNHWCLLVGVTFGLEVGGHHRLFDKYSIHLSSQRSDEWKAEKS